jgi:DNA-directed RNA polymerase specialized sigma24 family protein
MSRFDTTHWSVVSAAGSSDSGRARPALAALCQTYWRPLHQYLRNHGCSDEDARDLTQSFFASLIERGSVGDADRARGRFRAFLLASVRHFLLNDIAASRALKRGGGTIAVPIDAGGHETTLTPEALTDRKTPDRVFDREWALAVLAHVTERLRSEWVSAGKGYEFDVLAPNLAGDRPDGGYAALAVSIGSTEGAVKVKIHRLRQRYRRYLQEAIADTVTSPEEAEDELRHLMKALAG